MQVECEALPNRKTVILSLVFLVPEPIIIISANWSLLKKNDYEPKISLNVFSNSEFVSL